jgi:DNA-directed RNA polymerase specialized sigma subunit
MNKYLDFYCENNERRLKSISDTIIIKHFGWLPQKDYDDFYSIAGEVLWNCCQNYDGDKGAQFETYLINCLIRKFKTRITYTNRQRRNNGNQDVSLDALIDENDTCLGDLIASDNKNEVEVYSDKMINYLNKLSKIQKQVLFAMSEGYSSDEIRRILNISAKELSDACAALRSYRNVSLLY